jgi:ankyrin repeat protein
VKKCPDVAYDTPEDRLTKSPQYGKDLNKMILNISDKEISSDDLMRTSSNRIHPTECLVEAVWMNNENLIKIILKDSRINTGAALLIAAAEGHLNIVKMLINYQVYGYVKKSSRGDELKNNARENKTIERRGSGIYGRRGPALRAAARNGRLNVVSYLLMMQAEGVEGALIEAITNQHYDVFNLLVEDKRYDNNRVLIETAKLGNLVAVKTMIDKGAENIDGALMAAAEKGHLAIVKYLIEEKAGFADGALSIAMENGHADIVLYLCRKNKQINV